MNKKLIIVVTGRKDAGKSTIANQFAAAWLNAATPSEIDREYWVGSSGKLFLGSRDHVTTAVRVDVSHEALGPGGLERVGVRIISFASLLKEFCVNVLGLKPESVYGTNDQKNQLTHVHWNGLPWRVRVKYSTAPWLFKWLRPRRHHMTGREVMQVFGTDIIRRWYSKAWANAAYGLAMRVPETLVCFSDGRFPNEVTTGSEYDDPAAGVFVRCVRTLRVPHPEDRHPSETALDDFDLDWFDLLIHRWMNATEQDEMVRESLGVWASQAGLPLPSPASPPVAPVSR